MPFFSRDTRTKDAILLASCAIVSALFALAAIGTTDPDKFDYPTWSYRAWWLLFPWIMLATLMARDSLWRFAVVATVGLYLGFCCGILTLHFESAGLFPIASLLLTWMFLPPIFVGYLIGLLLKKCFAAGFCRRLPGKRLSQNETSENIHDL